MSVKEFKYVIQDPIGIHARPAGQLVVLAKEFQSETTIQRDDNITPLTNLMKLLGMGIKQDDEIIVKADGEDEEAAIEKLQAFFRENL